MHHQNISVNVVTGVCNKNNIIIGNDICSLWTSTDKHKTAAYSFVLQLGSSIDSFVYCTQVSRSE